MIYAIGDLHLSFSTNKPMDIFGYNWSDYEKKIEKNWLNKITENDLVLLPGDFSWCTYIEDAKLDFEYINKLPGKKILLKGNHDYWWETVTKMNSYIKNWNFENINFLFNNAYVYDGILIVGTRGWTLSETDDIEQDKKMIARECIRLENSIEYGIKNFEFNDIICMMHYPPITKQMVKDGQTSPFIEVLKKYNINKCVYAHLHGEAQSNAILEKYEGIDFQLVSSDYLNFDPKQLFYNNRI